MVPVGPSFRAGAIHPSLVQSIVNLLIGPIRNPSEHLPLPPQILLQQHRMRTPDHSHSRSSPGLDPGHTILEHQAFLGVNDRFSLGSEFFVDTFQRQEVNVRCGLAPPIGYPGIIAKDTARGWERAEEVRQVG